MSGGSDRISLGAFAVFFGISMIIALRSGPNDMYAAVLIFMIALFQLFEYGVWRDLQCNPGKSNNRASRGAYILVWAMPAVLSLVAFMYGDFIIADPASRYLLLGVSFSYFALLAGILPIVFGDKRSWCSTPGNLWQPIWWFQREEVPVAPNIFWLLGMIFPTLLVDPSGLGAGTVTLGIGSYLMGKWADGIGTGEWLSVTSLMSNTIALWALMLPGFRYMFFGYNHRDVPAVTQ
jgi:hypothetical protein